MKKAAKPYIAILLSVFLTLIISAGIVANAEYDEYGNYYEPYAEESLLEGYSSVDTSELTSEDWSKVQENLNSTFQLNSETSKSEGDFKNIKEDSNPNDDINDTWWYLLFGLLFIIIGVSAIVMVIASTVHFKNSSNHNSSNKRRENSEKK